MDTTIKFRTSTRQKESLELAAEQYGLTMSTLLRRGADLARRGLVASDAALVDFRQVREFANAAMAALDAGADGGAVMQARMAISQIHRLANANLQAGQ